jgi:hypothetical protein
MLNTVHHSDPDHTTVPGPAAAAAAQSSGARQRLERFLRIRRAETQAPDRQHFRPTLTLSRQAGLNGRGFAARLANYLESIDGQNPTSQWICVDSSLIDTLIEQLGDPRSAGSAGNARVIPFSIPGSADTSAAMEKGAASRSHSPSTVALRRFCELGNAIIVGRGAHCSEVSGDLENVFRIRLIADLEQRIENFAERAGMHNLDQAAAILARVDDARHQHVQRKFHSDLDDPLAFDLTINLSHMNSETAVSVIGDALLEWSANHASPEA